MKAIKKAVALTLALVVVASFAVVPVHAADIDIDLNLIDFDSMSRFLQWSVNQSDKTANQISNKVRHIWNYDVCPSCPNSDGHHNFVQRHTQVGGQVGEYYICEYCGKSGGAALQDGYNKETNDMPFKGIDNENSYLWYPKVNDLDTISLYRMWYGNRGMGLMFEPPYYLTPADLPYNGSIDNDTSYVSKSSDRIIFARWVRNYGDDQLHPVYSTAVVAPVSGTYQVMNTQAAVYSIDGTEYTYNYNEGSAISRLAGDYVGIGGTSWYDYSDDADNWKSGSELRCSFILPVFRVIPNEALDNTLYGTESRPASIIGKYVLENGDAYEDNSTVIVHEDDNSVYNPVTGDTTTYNDWTYDYSTRTYYMTGDDGKEGSVTYGDDDIIISEGGNTFHINYGTIINNNGSDDNGGGGSGGSGGSGGNGSGSSSDDNGGGSGSDTGIIAKLGEALGAIVNGLLGGITAFLSKIFDALISLGTMIGEKFAAIVALVLSWFESIPQMFAGFLAFLTAVFPFLPAEAMLLLTFGLAAVIFVGIIKAIRR